MGTSLIGIFFFPLRISIPQNSALTPDVFMNYDIFLVVLNL